MKELKFHEWKITIETIFTIQYRLKHFNTKKKESKISL